MKIIARESRAAVFVCAGIVLAYVVLGLVLLAPDAVYSGDIGVKFVQARALAATASLPRPAVSGAVLDPSRQFFPMRPPFVMSFGWTAQAIFSPAAAVLQSLLVAAGGLRGLIVGSVLSGAVILLAAVRMAEPGTGSPSQLRLGSAARCGFTQSADGSTRRQSRWRWPALRSLWSPVGPAHMHWRDY